MNPPDAGQQPEVSAAAVLEWLLSCVLARYSYGESAWLGLDPEERSAIAEPYLPWASRLTPMVGAELRAAGLLADPAAVEQAQRDRAAVEGLLHEWTNATCQTDGAPCSWHRVAAECADELRTALAAAQPTTPDPTPPGGNLGRARWGNVTGDPR